MSEIGTILKEKREQLGYSVEEISEITTILPRYINALEQNDFDAIPGEYYVKTFLKQYGTILKLDSNKLIKTYEKELLAIQKADLESAPIETSATPIDIATMTKPVMTADLINEMSEEEDVVLAKRTEKVVRKIPYGLIALLLAIVCAAIFLLPNMVRSLMSSSTTQTVTTTTLSTVASSSSSMSESATNSETTAASTTETTIQTTETTVATTQQTTVATTQAVTSSAPTETQSVQPAVAKEPTFVTGTINRVATSASETTYALGGNYNTYKGYYTFGVQVSEPTWVRYTIYNQVTYEGMISPNKLYTFRAQHNAENVSVLFGITKGAKFTVNGQNLPIPDGNRVQTINVKLP